MLLLVLLRAAGNVQVSIIFFDADNSAHRIPLTSPTRWPVRIIRATIVQWRGSSFSLSIHTFLSSSPVSTRSPTLVLRRHVDASECLTGHEPTPPEILDEAESTFAISIRLLADALTLAGFRPGKPPSDQPRRWPRIFHPR